MPVGVQLVDARGLDDGDVIAGASHELQAYGKILFREAAWYRQSGEAAQISDAAERICVRKPSLEVQVQRRRGDRLRYSHQQVKGIKQCLHFLLENLADALCLQIIGAAKLLVHVAGDLSQ